MIRGLTLRRLVEAQAPIPNRGDGFRIRIEALDAVGLPNQIFLHRRRLVNPETGLTGDQFVTVCAPEDLGLYPANDPDITQTPPYFRKAEVDAIVGSRSIADLLWTTVRQQVDHLMAALNRKDRLAVVDTVRVGESEESLSISEAG